MAGEVKYIEFSTGVVVDPAFGAVDSYYNEDATGWTGAVSSVSYTVTVQNAKIMVWQLKDNANNYEIMAPAITHTSDTNVTVTFGFPIVAGTYTLVGR